MENGEELKDVSLISGKTVYPVSICELGYLIGKCHELNRQLKIAIGSGSIIQIQRHHIYLDKLINFMDKVTVNPISIQSRFDFIDRMVEECYQNGTGDYFGF